MKRFAFAVIGVAALLIGTASQAGFVDKLISGRRLLVKDNIDVSKRKIRFLSKDASFTVAGMDPTLTGATFHLVDPSPGQQTNEFSMPAARWVERKGKFKYVDADLVEGPVKRALLKNGRVRLTLNGDQIDFDVLGVAPLQEVGGVMTVGTTRICFLFPGDDGQVKKDSPIKGIFVAVKAEAPDFCPSIS
jgi:hypothetical protein